MPAPRLQEDACPPVMRRWMGAKRLKPASRAPLAPWPQVPALLASIVREGLEADVSFAVRGNLLLLSPPLVIGEQDLADALALLDRLLARHAPNVP